MEEGHKMQWPKEI